MSKKNLVLAKKLVALAKQLVGSAPLWHSGTSDDEYLEPEIGMHIAKHPELEALENLHDGMMTLKPDLMRILGDVRRMSDAKMSRQTAKTQMSALLEMFNDLCTQFRKNLKGSGSSSDITPELMSLRVKLYSLFKGLFSDDSHERKDRAGFMSPETAKLITESRSMFQKLLNKLESAIKEGYTVDTHEDYFDMYPQDIPPSGPPVRDPFFD